MRIKPLDNEKGILYNNQACVQKHVCFSAGLKEQQSR